MWPFNKTKWVRLGLVDPNKKTYRSHREFIGNMPISAEGFRALAIIDLNAAHRHCKIGKVLLKPNLTAENWG